MADDFEIHGLESLQKKLQMLQKEATYKGASFAGRKSAKIIKEAVIQNAKSIDNPKTSEDISKNVVLKFSPKEFKKNGNILFRIGILGGAKKKEETGNPGGDTWYWRFIEFGTSRFAAKPFVKPALEQNAEKATIEFVNQFESWIDKQLKKIGKGK